MNPFEFIAAYLVGIPIYLFIVTSIFRNSIRHATERYGFWSDGPHMYHLFTLGTIIWPLMGIVVIGILLVMLLVIFPYKLGMNGSIGRRR